MPSSEKNLKNLRRVCFVDETDYNLFKNHLIQPLLSNLDDLQKFLENVVQEDIKASVENTKYEITFYKKMDKQIQKHIIYKKIYDSYLPFTHPHEFLILILKQLFKIIIFEKKLQVCNSVEESSLINESMLILIRFVNGLLDYFQKYKYAQSLVKLGESVNLPPWIVELRHNGTHERKLPNMHLIKRGLYFSLHYLLDNFWNINNSLQDEISIPTEEESKENNVELPKQTNAPTQYVLLRHKRRSNESLTELHKQAAIDSWIRFFERIKKNKYFLMIINNCLQNHKKTKKTSSFKSHFTPQVPATVHEKTMAFIQEVQMFWKTSTDYEKCHVINTHYELFVKNLVTRTFTKFCCLNFFKFDFYFLQVSAQHPNFLLSVRLLDLNKVMNTFESSIKQFDKATLQNIILATKNTYSYKEVGVTLKDTLKEKSSVDNKDFGDNTLIGSINANTDNADAHTRLHQENYKFVPLPNWKPKPFGVL
ncbi:uncharacterized protein HGUI_01315 [Hanseniaspora guilliermondii]|uniref:Protein LAS1 n=1 Tax=Hanseniaspora guilliermondii TaxID=56406 RepID=A0A1L0B2F7_9ASCO|nr:uncharacterized protein HGUI_01315 [Hanseniaspora guilliermondii]